MEAESKSSIIDQEAGLEVCGDSREIYEQVLRLMLSYETEKGQVLTDSYRNQDWKLFGNEVHALKSSAAGIGAAALSKAARELEEAVDAEDYTFVEIHQEAFFQLLHDTLSEIHRILGMERKE